MRKNVNNLTAREIKRDEGPPGMETVSLMSSRASAKTMANPLVIVISGIKFVRKCSLTHEDGSQYG